MFGSLLLAGALLSSQTGGAVAPSARGPGAGESCSALPQCLEHIRDPNSRVMLDGSTVYQDLVRFGAPAVDALVPMLMDPDLRLRERAGYFLAQFPNIDPRHFPALLHAWRHGDVINHQGRGNGWLPRALAATGTDEALALLWSDFERNPEMGANAQTFFALAWRLPDRTRPLLLARFAACRGSETHNPDAGPDRSPCAGNYALLAEFRPPYPDWSVTAILDLAERARSDQVRAVAERTLADLRHPAALAPLQRRLAALPRRPTAEDMYWEAGGLIRMIERYGPAARASGPAIVPYLGAAYHPELRVSAALALGRIDAQRAIPALLALAPDFADDWLLAYNVAESLGRLRATEARPLLERLARDYWHRGVRNNATRALNAIAGNAFARQAGATSDDPAYADSRDEDGQGYTYFGDLRFAGDQASGICPERPSQDVIETDIATRQQLRRRIPVSFAQGEVVFGLPVPGGTLVGVNGGEFGGGLIMLPHRGPPRKLLGSPVVFAWQRGNSLYVATGLAHMVLDTGTLHVVDPARGTVERSIRLPASPRRLHRVRGNIAVIDTGAGQVAIRPGGQLVDVEQLPGCRDS